MNAPDYIGNAISTYRMCKEDLIPGIPDQRETYDKLAVVMVCLNPKSKKGDPLTRMLGVLLAPGVTTTSVFLHILSCGRNGSSYIDQ